jgi:hypothetical protein
VTLIGTSTFLKVSGADGAANELDPFCVNPATGADLIGGECASAVFPTTDLTGLGTEALPDLDPVKSDITAAISALVATDLTAVSSVE